MSGRNVCYKKKVTIHCVTRSQVLLCLKSSMTSGVLLHFFLHFSISTFITNQSWELPVLPHRRNTPALSSPLIKAAENVPSSCRRQPGLVKCSAPECHSSWTPGSRLISSTFYSRGHTGEGTRTDCHNSSQCCLCSGSPLHVIQGIYTHTREHVWQWLCSCL